MKILLAVMLGVAMSTRPTLDTQVGKRGRISALLAVVMTAGCAGNSLAPADSPAMHVDPALQSVMDYIDADPSAQPVIGMSWGQWVRANADSIVLSDAVPIPIDAWAIRKHRRIELTSRADLTLVSLLAGQIIHEARHLEGADHECVNHIDDRDASGAWGLHAIFLAQHGRQSDAEGIRQYRIGCHQ